MKKTDNSTKNRHEKWPIAGLSPTEPDSRSLVTVRIPQAGKEVAVPWKNPGVWVQNPRKLDDYYAAGRLVTVETDLVALGLLMRKGYLGVPVFSVPMQWMFFIPTRKSLPFAAAGDG